MQQQLSPAINPHAGKTGWLRLVALWVLAETLLGGFLHGLKLPVTGLLVGGSAMLCIMMLSWHFPKRGSVLKAMLLVMLMKFSLSPHSPFPAYLAVLFQGITGEFLLRGRHFFLLKCLLFGFLGMMESATQRLLVLVFVSGTEIWEALDLWVSKVSSGLGPARFSQWLAFFYLLVHALAGLVLGGLGYRLISAPQDNFPHLNPVERTLPSAAKTTRQKYRIAGPAIAILAFSTWLLLEISWLKLPGKQFFFVPLILRMIWLYGILVYLLLPLLDRMFRKFLSGKAAAYSATLEEIKEILPEMLSLVNQAWTYRKQNSLGMLPFLQLLIFTILQADEKNLHPARREESREVIDP
jgi:hypothetical protein